MLPELLEFLKPREERITWAGKAIVVKELTDGADLKGIADGVDVDWKIRVRCIFLESGEPLFKDEDIAQLKSSSSNKLVTLVNAVNRVNGFDAKAEEKNSVAAQG